MRRLPTLLAVLLTGLMAMLIATIVTAQRSPVPVTEEMPDDYGGGFLLGQLLVSTLVLAGLFLGLRYLLQYSWVRHILALCIVGLLVWLGYFVFSLLHVLQEGEVSLWLVFGGTFAVGVGMLLLLYSDAYYADIQPDQFRIS